MCIIRAMDVIETAPGFLPGGLGLAIAWCAITIMYCVAAARQRAVELVRSNYELIWLSSIIIFSSGFFVHSVDAMGITRAPYGEWSQGGLGNGLLLLTGTGGFCMLAVV